jgi:hypothetical protein
MIILLLLILISIGLFLQGIYFLTGSAMYPAFIVYLENYNTAAKEFFSFERREMSTSHDLIELYRRTSGISPVKIINFLLLSSLLSIS